MTGWAAVLVSHGQLPDSGCRSSSLHQKQRHSIEGRRTSPYPTHPQDTFSRLSAPQYRHAVTPPCGSPGMPRGRTSTAAAQANAVMRRHPDCSEGRRRLVARSPHGHEQHARTTDATGREPRVPRSYGRYLVALYNGCARTLHSTRIRRSVDLRSAYRTGDRATSGRPASHYVDFISVKACCHLSDPFPGAAREREWAEPFGW